MEQTCNPVERRIAVRVDVDRAISVVSDAQERRGRTVNVSTSGVLISMEGELTIWAEVEVGLPGIGRRPARVVRRDGERYGLVFREPLLRAEFVGFTGYAIAEDEPDPEVAETGPMPRIAPWAFGRDKVKGFRRRAAEHAAPRPSGKWSG